MKKCGIVNFCGAARLNRRSRVFPLWQNRSDRFCHNSYGYLDKVMSVVEGDRTITYSYHPDGQLARVTKSGRACRSATAASEEFEWDGLALIRRGNEKFINEPHVGNAPKKLRFEGKPQAERSARRARKGPRGNPIASSKGVTYFNDLLGTSVGAKSGATYTAAALSAFGEPLQTSDSTTSQQLNASTSQHFFIGKP